MDLGIKNMADKNNAQPPCVSIVVNSAPLRKVKTKSNDKPI